MTKEYFPHDYNAIEDKKTLKIQMSLGMLGYGIYWALVELLHRRKGDPIMEEELETIAFQFRCDLEDLRKVIELSLTKDNKNGVCYFSERVAKNFEKRKEKFSEISNKRSEAGRKGMAARWEKNNKPITKDNKPLQSITKGKGKGKEKVNRTESVLEETTHNFDEGKKQFGEFVRLDLPEEMKLKQDCGNENLFDEIIEELNIAIGRASPEQVSAKYSKHFYAFKAFLRQRKNKSPGQNLKINEPARQFKNISKP